MMTASYTEVETNKTIAIRGLQNYQKLIAFCNRPTAICCSSNQSIFYFDVVYTKVILDKQTNKQKQNKTKTC